MALFENGLKGSILTGLAIGLGTAILAPVLANAAKPVLKAAIKGGIILYEKGKESVAEAGEVFEDLVAEAKAELEADATCAAAAQPPDAPKA